MHNEVFYGYALAGPTFLLGQLLNRRRCDRSNSASQFTDVALLVTRHQCHCTNRIASAYLVAHKRTMPTPLVPHNFVPSG
jgi:hypothetical protein